MRERIRSIRLQQPKTIHCRRSGLCTYRGIVRFEFIRSNRLFSNHAMASRISATRRRWYDLCVRWRWLACRWKCPLFNWFTRTVKQNQQMILIFCAPFLHSDYVYSFSTKTWPNISLWETRESMPVQKFRFVAAESDGRIYVAGGDSDGKFSDEFYCYDTTSDTWTKKAPIRLQSTNGVLFKSNTFLYVIGVESILHRYNPEEDNWTKVNI